jgi:2-polyprenyl-3-methyl-5-hydroxy-6-metoxy-1,4-benzoquinol methylase
VLDAGCGEGYLSRKLAEEGAAVTGIDSSRELINAARAHELVGMLPVDHLQHHARQAAPASPG